MIQTKGSYACITTTLSGVAEYVYKKNKYLQPKR